MAVTPQTLLHGAVMHFHAPGTSSSVLLQPHGLEGCWVVFWCQQLQQPLQWHDDGNGGRGGRSSVNVLWALRGPSLDWGKLLVTHH